MKYGDVMRKERERRGLSIEDVATRLGLSAREYMALESGESSVEEWGPKLSLIAIKLKVPTSRLISENGRSAGYRSAGGNCGRLIKARRDKVGLTQEELARRLEIPLAELISIEDGLSPLETYGPLLLHFAEIINQPLFNLSYPCGVPFDRLSDYA